MKFAFTILVIASLVSMAVFGFLAMGGHEHSSSAHSDCLAATATAQAVCPGALNLADFLQFHVGAFKSYSTAIISIVFSLIGLLFISLTDRIRKIPSWAAPDFSPGFLREFAVVRSYSSADFLNWLSLLERRDFIRA